MSDANSGPALPRIRVSALILRGDEVALVEFHTTALGTHYDLPGGGLDPGESLRDGVRRECREELGCDVAVGRLLMVAEYFPGRDAFAHDGQPTLDFIFECAVAGDQQPRLPDVPDEDQIGARWMPIETLSQRYLKPVAAALLIQRARGTGGDLLNTNVWAGYDSTQAHAKRSI
jgi:8-oxo-dGTP diphosphatase